MSDRLAAWRQRLEPREIQLSDGLTMLIRPVRVDALVMNGTIPLHVWNEAEAARLALREKEPQRGGNFFSEQSVAFTPVVNAVVMAAALDPAVTADGAGDSIPIDAIPLSDRYLIMDAARQWTAALGPFRGEPGGDAGDARDSEDVRVSAE